MWSAYYAIDAKPEGTQTAAMMLGPMLQALLEDRFKLKIHREAKEAPAYALWRRAVPSFKRRKREVALRWT